MRVNERRVTISQAKLRCWEDRIAADDAKYKGQGDAAGLAQAAFRAEKQLAYEEAQLRVIETEAAVVIAERGAAVDSSTAPALEKSKQELAAARSTVDVARTAITAVGETYTPLSPLYPAESTGRRLALAKWITSPDNPLTARVAVNHIWLRHFGRGLVETTSNFGRSGRPSSHPELLDWLAVELMENGWQMKHIHRMIVTSQTYRRRSHIGSSMHDNLASDPDNLYYWRANTRRMEAEVVRDSLLSCANELDTTIGGPELDPAQGASSRRRSLYFAIHGEGKMPFLDLFDAPDVCDCYQRTASVRPQQALALSNSELPLEMSRVMAGKLSAAVNEDVPGDARGDRSFICAAFESVLSRPPSDLEVQAALDYLGQQTSALSAASFDELTAAPPAGVRAAAQDLPQRAGRR